MRRRKHTRAPETTQLVVGHANPDFDAYAAMIAATKLYNGAKAVYLGSQNANVREFHNLHEEFLDFIDVRAIDPDAIERVIMVDTRDPGRVGEVGDIVRRPGIEVVVYDHHPRSEGDLRVADDRSMDVGAVTSILVHEIRQRGIAVTPLEASAMLLGIHEDTGSLTYPNTTAYDAEAVVFLMSAGADLEVVARFLARALTQGQRELLEAVLDSLEVWDVHGQQIAVGVAVADVYVDSASVLTHYICEDLGYRVALAVVRMPERLHVVGRSRVAEIDMGAVLGHLGGGGHPQAASAALKEGTAEEALLRLRDALELEVPPPLRARDIMSAPVRTITSQTTMAQAGRLMATWGHGGLPVVDDDELVGLVTRKDVDKASRHGLDHAPVTGFMARQPHVVTPDADLGELERLLVRTGIGRVPVLSDGELTGIVTRKDLLRAEHGDTYLDRRVTRERSEASQRFMASFSHLLPVEAREAVETLGLLAGEDGLRAHVVGGFVRDMLIGRPNLDIDVVIEGDGLAFAERVAERLGARVRVHRRFGTAVLILSKTLHVDITSARTEYYTRPGALPTVERSSLRQDLFRRDFSVNAMAACINPESFGIIADPFGGLHDLERGVIRTLHSLSFVEDPTRVLRAARFEKRYGFKIDPSTEALLRQAVDMQMLDEVSGARIREEILDIIDEQSVTPIMERLHELGALDLLLPQEARAHKVLEELALTEVAYHTLAEWFEREPHRRIALLIPFAATVPTRVAEHWTRWLRFGREYGTPIITAAEKRKSVVARLRDRRGMKDSRLYALLDELPAETVVYLWAICDAVGRERIERFVKVLSAIRTAVTGEDLVALGFAPGPYFSAILSESLSDRLDGRAVGREAELANLRRLARKHAND
jgi:tRNA nucleotidyltransferase (CCA-adding enzyme)